MKNLQRAINYETMICALHKADSYVMPLFLRLMDWCNVDEPMQNNMASFSFVSGADEKDLISAYSMVSSAFNRLQEDVEIIDSSDDYWPKDATNCQFLYLRGKKELLGKKGLSIVGTRLPSDRGLELTKQTVDAVGKDYVIISGLAKGIDGVAHLQALKNQFDTIAVIGTNIADYYPPEHKQLQDFIAENGLVVSQFAPSRKTENYFFMNRNKLMSEIAYGSLIAESADSGGGVKQAFFSEKQDKPIFIFKETYDNSQLHWPHEFENPIIVESPCEICDYLSGSKPIPKTQPNLF